MFSLEGLDNGNPDFRKEGAGMKIQMPLGEDNGLSETGIRIEHLVLGVCNVRTNVKYKAYIRGLEI